MAKKDSKSRPKKLIKRPKVLKKAKLTTRKTKQQAGEKIKSISDQVAGTKEHGVEEVSAPRITNDTVAEHREQVLAEARRFIYPLQSRRKIVITSISIIFGLIALTVFFTGLLLYQFKSTGSFAYNISRLVPFPVARVDGHFVAYEQYLFEVRNSLHYLSNFAQEGIELDSEEGKQLADETKRRILEKVQIDALGNLYARDYDIKVTDEEIEEQIKLFEVRGGIDQSEGTLESVLAKYYDWDLKDLRRVVRQQLINEKLLPVLDKDANAKLDEVKTKLAEGMSFADAVTSYSEDDLTVENGGALGEISRDNNAYDKESLDAMFSVGEGEYTEAIVTPAGYYVFYINEVVDEDTVDVSQLLIRFFDLESYLAEKLETVAHRAYITID